MDAVSQDVEMLFLGVSLWLWTELHFYLRAADVRLLMCRLFTSRMAFFSPMHVALSVSVIMLLFLKMTINVSLFFLLLQETI